MFRDSMYAYQHTLLSDIPRAPTTKLVLISRGLVVSLGLLLLRTDVDAGSLSG